MNEQEGVIKYQLDHQFQKIDLDVAELIAWRTLLYKLELINQRSDKYAGLSYGNLSQRNPDDSECFMITASQTGHLANVSQDDFALVTEYNIKQNSMKSIGTKPPSSEALTHAAIYHANHSVQAVVHVHSPVIWQYTHELGLTFTEREIAYGTVAMADAVTSIAASNQHQMLFSMLGHEDGVVVYGNSITNCCLLLLETYAKAVRFNQLTQTTGK